MKVIGWLYETDLIVLSADYKPKVEESEIAILDKEMKSKFDKFHEVQQDFEKTMKSEMESLREILKAKKEEIKEESEPSQGGTSNRESSDGNQGIDEDDNEDDDEDN